MIEFRKVKTWLNYVRKFLSEKFFFVDDKNRLAPKTKKLMKKVLDIFYDRRSFLDAPKKFYFILFLFMHSSVQSKKKSEGLINNSNLISLIVKRPILQAQIHLTQIQSWKKPNYCFERTFKEERCTIIFLSFYICFQRPLSHGPGVWT